MASRHKDEGDACRDMLQLIFAARNDTGHSLMKYTGPATSVPPPGQCILCSRSAFSQRKHMQMVCAPDRNNYLSRWRSGMEGMADHQFTQPSCVNPSMRPWRGAASPSMHSASCKKER